MGLGRGTRVLAVDGHGRVGATLAAASAAVR